MAGFFDGEGSINIVVRQRKHFSPEHTLNIAIGQKDGATLDWIKDNFGGRIYVVKRDGSFFWAASNIMAYSIIKMILPYLKYKKPQAEIAIEFYEGKLKKNNRKITHKEIERRESIRKKLKLLKHDIIESHYAGTTTKRADPTGM